MILYNYLLMEKLKLSDWFWVSSYAHKVKSQPKGIFTEYFIKTTSFAEVGARYLFPIMYLIGLKCKIHMYHVQFFNALHFMCLFGREIIF